MAARFAEGESRVGRARDLQQGEIEEARGRLSPTAVGGGSPESGLRNVSDNAEDVVQLDTVAGFEAARHGFLAHAGEPHLAL